VDITHHHASINSFGHIVDSEKGNLYSGEKPSKNNELRKAKTNRAKFCEVKQTSGTKLGHKKRISQETYKTESIRTLAKGNLTFMLAWQDAFHPHTKYKMGIPLCFSQTSTPLYPHQGLFDLGPIQITPSPCFAQTILNTKKPIKLDIG